MSGSPLPEQVEDKFRGHRGGFLVFSLDCLSSWSIISPKKAAPVSGELQRIGCQPLRDTLHDIRDTNLVGGDCGFGGLIVKCRGEKVGGCA